MRRRKIGVMVESFRLGPKEGIVKAAELGADGIQMYVTHGEVSPEALDKEARQALRKFVADRGLVFSALCADYGQGFLDASRNAELVAKTKACMDLAVDLGTNVVTTHIGKLPESAEDSRWQAAYQACSELAVYGDSIGVCFATETGPESPQHLYEFLSKISSSGARVNYDPANFCMYGFDQLAGVKILQDYIVHTHAKDGMKGVLKEVPLGEGDVDLPAWVALLDEISYDGFLTIEREVGADPVGDIAKAVQYLRSL